MKAGKNRILISEPIEEEVKKEVWSKDEPLGLSTASWKDADAWKDADVRVYFVKDIMGCKKINKDIWSLRLNDILAYEGQDEEKLEELIKNL